MFLKSAMTHFPGEKGKKKESFQEYVEKLHLHKQRNMQGMETLQMVRERNRALPSPATFVISTSWCCHAALNATQALRLHVTCPSLLHDLFTHHTSTRDTQGTQNCRISKFIIILI